MPEMVTRLNAALDGHYRIDQEAGEGGMATVFLATDLRHDRRVAIKVIRAEVAQVLGPERFLREIRIAARLDHPNIVALYDSGDADGLLYYVMPFVDGESLRNRLTREGQLSIGDALRIATQVADALAYAHKRGVIHRDIKPENILLSGAHAKLVDFGIAVGADSTHTRLTQTGIAVGTPAYMSPEQIVGAALDGRSDLYSLGCVLFEMLAGSVPFGGTNAQATMARRFSDEAPRVAQLRPSVPPMVDLVLTRALARDPSERHATVAEFGAALITELSGATVVDTPAAAGGGQALRTALVGRERELAEAREFLARLATGKGGLLLIGGEPGVGKTRLSKAIMDEARALRALCLVGRCYEMEGMPPFTPYAEVLDLVARQVPLRTFREVLGDAAPEIAKIQPSLREVFPDIPAALELPPEQQRPYLFRKYREHAERAARVNPIVMLLDDLHWADDASLALLENIAGYLSELPIFVIGTYRDVELEVNRPFARVLESLTRQRLATRLSLRRLDESRVAELLTSLGGGSPPSRLVRVVFNETEGNPFFVEEVFHHLDEEGRLFTAPGEWRNDLKVEDLDVPEGVRLVIGRRLERLTPTCRTVLTSAAVIGSRFDVAVLQALGEQSEDDLLDALDAAVAAHLLVAQRGGREVIYGFAHELIRHTLLGTLSLPRRQRRHLKIATAMESVLGDRVRQRASDLAYHLYQAGAAADPDQTVKVLTLAAEQAIAGTAFAEALDHCDRAATIEEVGDRSVTGHLLRVRGNALKGLGRWSEARAVLAQALEALNAAGDPLSAARVAFDLAILELWEANNQRAHDLCSAALPALADGLSRERARVLAADGLAQSVLSESGYDDGLRLLSEARSMGAALNDNALVGITYYFEALLQWSYGRINLTIAAAEEAIPRLASPADVQWRVDAAGHRLYALAYAGRFGEIDAAVDGVQRLAEEVGHAGAVWLCKSVREWVTAARSGDLVGHETWIDESVTTTPAIGAYVFLNVGWAAVSRAQRGDLEAAVALATWARQAFPPTNQFTGLIDGCELLCMALAGRVDWPVRYSERRHLVPNSGVPAFSGRVWFATCAVVSHVIQGDFEAAAALYSVLRQHLDGGFRMAVLQPGDSVAGLAAAAGGQLDLAEGHFRSALALVNEMGDKIGKPSVQRWYAWMLQRRDAPGDRERARALLDEAIPSFRALGMKLALGQAEELRAQC